jgi:very-short-patch-repair endonuclease
VKIGDFARQLRHELTDTERLLWRELRAHRFQGFKFRRQQPLGDYIVDFICFEQKLIIELDGGQHADAQDYDRQRDAWLSAQGYSVLRFWNNEVQENLDGALEHILISCGRAPSPQPLPHEGGGAQANDNTRILRAEVPQKTQTLQHSAPLPPREEELGGEGEA